MSIQTFRQEAHTVKADLDKRVMVYKYNGNFLPEQAREIVRFSNKILEQHPGFYAICDVGGLKQVPAETRKFLIAWFKEQRFPAIVCFGASLSVRTIVTLITSAARLLSGDIPRYVFVNSEAEAYAWIEGQRGTSLSA